MTTAAKCSLHQHPIGEFVVRFICSERISKPEKLDQRNIGMFRRFDGFSNNLMNTNWGAIDQHLAREVPSAYSDGLLAPAAQCTENARLD